MNFKGKKLPLIDLEDILTEFNEDALLFVLYIVMKKASGDLSNIIKKNCKEMNFLDFFFVFRDTILAITYMHTNCLAHRDIKPDNILKMENGKYIIMDFGIGINLENEEGYNPDDYSYNIGEWPLAGTIPYLAPILKEHF